MTENTLARAQFYARYSHYTLKLKNCFKYPTHLIIIFKNISNKIKGFLAVVRTGDWLVVNMHWFV